MVEPESAVSNVSEEAQEFFCIIGGRAGERLLLSDIKLVLYALDAGVCTWI